MFPYGRAIIASSDCGLQVSEQKDLEGSTLLRINSRQKPIPQWVMFSYLVYCLFNWRLNNFIKIVVHFCPTHNSEDLLSRKRMMTLNVPKFCYHDVGFPRTLEVVKIWSVLTKLRQSRIRFPWTTWSILKEELQRIVDPNSHFNFIKIAWLCW